MAASRLADNTGVQQRLQGVAAGSIEEEAGSRLKQDRGPNALPKVNIQQFSGLAFFAALNVYKNKDTAMAFAICLEAALYWEFQATPQEIKARKEDLQRKAAASIRMQKFGRKGEQIPDGTRKTNSTRENVYGQAAGKGVQKRSPSPRTDARRQASGNSVKRRILENSPKGSGLSLDSRRQSAGAVKRPKKSEVFDTSSIEVGQVILLRTEPDDSATATWDKCWSLGKVLKISGSQRKKFEVLWLKPSTSDTRLPTKRIFAQQWGPWMIKNPRTGLWDEWVSSVTAASIQYGTESLHNGRFPLEVQGLLASEVARLEKIEE